MNIRTEKSFSERKTEREEVRSDRATKMLRGAMDRVKACVTRTAFKLGMSESLLRKYRDGGAQFGLHDIIGLATEEPETFDALLEELAALRNKEVVAKVDGATQAEAKALSRAVVKEGGDAANAVLVAVDSEDPNDWTAAIKELTESSRTDQGMIALFEARLAKHRGNVMSVKASARAVVS